MAVLILIGLIFVIDLCAGYCIYKLDINTKEQWLYLMVIMIAVILHTKLLDLIFGG